MKASNEMKRVHVELLAPCPHNALKSFAIARFPFESYPQLPDLFFTPPPHPGLDPEHPLGSWVRRGVGTGKIVEPLKLSC